MKKYGIYLAYPPGLGLETQGLGRHLLAFLDEARNFEDARFVIACPSWTRTSLGELLENGGMSLDAFELIGPEREPILLSAYEAYKQWKARQRSIGWTRRAKNAARRSWRRTIAAIERRTVASRNPAFLGFVALSALFGLLLRWTMRTIMRDLARLTHGRAGATHLRLRLDGIAARFLAAPQSSPTILRLYRLMEEVETEILRKHINRRKDVLAWYCPAAFWPHFNLIEAPRLVCVPDVVLSEFPVGFAPVNRDRFLGVFKSVEATIEGGDHFVTYSETIKRRTLVERYHVSPSRVTVVPHGANRLDKAIFMTGFPDNDGATGALCQSLIRRALRKAIGAGGPNAAKFDPSDTKFIFYASQIRPNKNVISLLRAHEFLLRRRYVGHKLVLTGDPNVLPEVAGFIREHNLQADVLCLHGLSEQELAACYRRADLAVNPSLSEGGCPFTLTEALSVGTPVVMARIAVTEEVITDTGLREQMLFDPHDWEDMAKRIEWALGNREALLERQMVLYESLAKRTWRNVVGEHIAILDRISGATATGGRDFSDPQRDSQEVEVVPRRQRASGGS